MLASVIITIKDTTIHLEKVLEALQGISDIIICDFQAPEDVVADVKGRGYRVVKADDSSIRSRNSALNVAMRMANKPWVLYLDDDEIVSPQLMAYLEEFMKDPQDIKGLYIPRKNYVFNKWRRDSYPDYQLRFFKKESSHFPHVNEKCEVLVTGRKQKIKANRRELALVHMSQTVAGMMRSLNYDTTHEVDNREAQRVRGWHLVSRPIMSFLHSYIIRGGFRYGNAGLIHSQNRACSTYMRLAKIMEKKLQEQEGYEELYS